jgi:general secretion pathway protein F
MNSFHFRAVTAEGAVRTGTLSAADEKRVAAELRRQGLIPLYVGTAPQGATEWKLRLPRFGGKRDVLFFTQELSTLLSAGVPIDRAIAITSELTEHAGFRPVIMGVLRTLKGGKSLADSLAGYPEYFPAFFVNMVRAGEASGSLAAVFERLAEYERTRDELRGYIISSLVYPALLSVVGLGSIIILLYYVVPRFSAVFADSRMTIPTVTRVLLETSALMRAYGGWALLGVAVALAALRLYIGTPAGGLWWDSTRLRIPLLGDALRKLETARFARAMGTLVANGVPLVQSLGIARSILANRRISGSLEVVEQGVKRGEGVAAPLARCGQFPPLAAHLLSIGEETGRLDAMFLRMAEIYDTDTRAAIKRFTALFEPLIILVMGVLVGVLILSMLLAITSINEVAV